MTRVVTIMAMWFVLVIGAPAFAHPLDAACLAQSKTTPMDCQAQHDAAGSNDARKAAFARLEQGQGRFPRAAQFPPTQAEQALRYLRLGFVHIIPKGLDHILFVLALFLGARTWRQLVAQVSAFTLAHSVTLALAAMSLIKVPASIVEPLIALSIAALALENVFFKKARPWRVLVVFGFGLFHGLGFAGVLSELGFGQVDFLVSLIAFNLGVEGGQLSVVALAAIPALVLRKVLTKENVPHLYDTILVRPASILIALVGLWWAYERVFSGG